MKSINNLLLLRSAGVDPAALTFAFRPLRQMDVPPGGHRDTEGERRRRSTPG